MRKNNSLSLPGINYWLCLALAILFGVVAVLSLRTNNLEAIRLRNDVLRVDQANGDAEKALQELRKYVYAHMHTSLASDSNVYPPVQLKYRYDRLVAAEKERVRLETANVFTDAQRLCEQQNPTDTSVRNRAPCIEQYISSHPVTERQIADDLYKFNFASPDWSPDLAGLSILLSGLFGFVGALSFLTEQWLKGRLL